jgi:hypothetical protein
MLENRIKELVNHIKERITLFGENGYYFDFRKDNADDFHGVDDSIDNYFFIQEAPKNEPNEYLFETKFNSCGTYDVTADLLFVAGLQCPILETAIISLTSALHSFADFDTEIDSISTNSEVIYKALYDENYQGDAQLILIMFKVKFLFETLDYCENNFCGDCCD